MDLDKAKLKISIDNTYDSSDDYSSDSSILGYSPEEESDNDVEFNVRLDSLPIYSEYSSNVNDDDNDNHVNKSGSKLTTQSKTTTLVGSNCTEFEDNATIINAEIRNVSESSNNSDSKTEFINTNISGPKFYKNKAGEFITGIDVVDDSDVSQKREQRAKRFGYPSEKNTYVFNRRYIFDSLNVTESEINDKDLGHRPTSIHMRGVDKMSTDDIFHYFQSFPASSIEWINDTSCNVVWEDESSCLRALFGLSRSVTEIENLSLLVNPSKNLMDNKANDGQETTIDKESPVTKNCEIQENVPDDYDELNLEEDEGTGVKHHADGDEKMDCDSVIVLDAPASRHSMVSDTSSRITSGETVAEDCSANPVAGNPDQTQSPVQSIYHDPDKDVALFETIISRNIKWPPGSWRLAIPCSKANFLFMRFANKDDVKVRGAERFSKYYRRYGNPNYNGMKGVISNSLKRRMRDGNLQKTHGQVQDPERTQSDEVDLLYDENPRNRNQVKEVSKRPFNSDDEEMDGELKQLLGSPKKKFMGMYADEIESSKSSRATIESGSGLRITAPSHDGRFGNLSAVDKTKDLRHKLANRR